MSLLRACRSHIHFFVIAPLLIIVMTWPTLVYVFDADTFWLPDSGKDLLKSFWEVWHWRQFLAGKTDLLYTDFQFYPQGLSLVYYQFSVPYMFVAGILQTAMPASNAYNLYVLLMLFANAAATYLLLLYIFRDKWLSLFGAALVAASPFYRLSLLLPDLSLIATLSLSVYFLKRSIDENRLSFAALAGLLAGATVFIGMYIFVCIVLTLGLLALYFARSRWRQRRFWRHIALLLAVLAAVSMLRVGPMIADRDSLAQALDKDEAGYGSSDLLGTLILPQNPITFPLAQNLPGVPEAKSFGRAYVGVIPLILTIAGLASRRHRRLMRPWLVMLTVFLALGLGESLTFKGENYPNIVLPLRALKQLFPALFRPFWNAQHFQIGALIPLAALACYGLDAVARPLRSGRAAPLVLTLVVLLALEYFTPLNPRVIDESQFRFIEWLEQEEQDPIRLINLPMRLAPLGYYSFFQSFTGYVQVGGVSNRPLAEIYSYLDGNPLLRAWRANQNYFCFPASAKTFDQALAQLLADGFTHIVLHDPLTYSKQIPVIFPHTRPAYKDDYVHVYPLADMRDACQHSAFLSDDVFPQLYAQLPPSTLRLGDEVTVLSIHPAADAAAAAQTFYQRIQETPPVLHLLTTADIHDSDADAGEGESEIERALADNSVLLLVYDPAATAPELVAAYSAWVETRFKACGQSTGASTLRLEYFAKPHIPCALLTSGEPLAVRYDNGMRLANALLHFDGEQLELRLLWQRLNDILHSASLQVFDESGARVTGIDKTIPRHDGPAFTLQLDLRSLEPGDYLAKLIVYNYETRADLPGIDIRSDRAFQRALALDRLTID